MKSGWRTKTLMAWLNTEKDRGSWEPEVFNLSAETPVRSSGEDVGDKSPSCSSSQRRVGSQFNIRQVAGSRPATNQVDTNPSEQQ